jgi:hypothetical protein
MISMHDQHTSEAISNSSTDEALLSKRTRLLEGRFDVHA